MRIAIVTTMWRRSEVFKIFGRLTNDMISDLGEHEIQVFCVGSEGNVSEKLAISYKFNYLEYPNEKLGRKWNEAATFARSFNPDYYLMMGSDDVMTATLLSRYIPYMKQGIDFIGLLDWFFYDAINSRSLYWQGYTGARRGETCGAGRMLSARLMNALKWQPWDFHAERYLDGTMNQKLKRIRHTSKAIKITDGDGIAIDIKTSNNITPFKKWDNSEYIENTELFKHFNEKQIQCLTSMNTIG